MSNTTVKISLPTNLKTTLQKLAQKKQYSTVSGFIQELIRRESTIEKEKSKLQKMIQEGLDSGLSSTPPDVFFKRMQQKIDKSTSK
jgi:Arc/MetJ-type ribon-helix-helix transcriptional regulator